MVKVIKLNYSVSVEEQGLNNVYTKYISTVSLSLYLPHDKTNKMACAPSEDSDQPGHLPNLIRVFAMHTMGS